MFTQSLRNAPSIRPLDTRADRVLLVDDDPDMLPPFQRALRQVQPSLVLHWATSLHGAERAMRHHHFRAVISDYQLEQGNGIAVCRTAIELLAADALAMISCHPIHEELAKVGAKDLRLLPKPFSPFELIRFLLPLVRH